MKIKYNELLDSANALNPLIVGVIGTRSELLIATMNARFIGYSLRPVTDLQKIDIYELRLDKLVGLEQLIMDFIKANAESSSPKPLIITARDASEGGVQSSWTISDRIKLYRTYIYMPYVTMLDIEAETAHELMVIILEAKLVGIGILISFHGLREFPPCSKIIDASRVCKDVGGCVFKMAIICLTVDDHLLLHDTANTIRRDNSYKVAAMAVEKPYGILSRYNDVINGGPFIYGYIREGVVAGQPRAIDARAIYNSLI